MGKVKRLILELDEELDEVLNEILSNNKELSQYYSLSKEKAFPKMINDGYRIFFRGHKDEEVEKSFMYLSIEKDGEKFMSRNLNIKKIIEAIRGDI